MFNEELSQIATLTRDGRGGYESKVGRPAGRARGLALVQRLAREISASDKRRLIV